MNLRIMISLVSKSDLESRELPMAYVQVVPSALNKRVHYSSYMHRALSIVCYTEKMLPILLHRYYANLE
jgi:hypothetical protein